MPDAISSGSDIAIDWRRRVLWRATAHNLQAADILRRFLGVLCLGSLFTCYTDTQADAQAPIGHGR